MRRPLTLDASVFVAACNRDEPGFGECRALLAAVRERDIPLIEPTLMPVETAGAIRRARGDANLAAQFAEAILQLPQITLVPCDEGLMQRAVEIAIAHALRGADAIYTATAFRYGAILVTLDEEQRRRVPKAVHARAPGDALKLI